LKTSRLCRGNNAGVVPSIPRRRAFLLQYSGDADPGRGRHCGRVEHVESGRSQRFGCQRDLEKFVAAVLSDESGESNGTPDGKESTDSNGFCGKRSP
jgi:hypothetical protein